MGIKMSHESTALSNRFERKEILDTRRKFPSTSRSREGFFRSGVTLACFRDEGNEGVDRERLTMRVIAGASRLRSTRSLVV
jgi:hypothetical protein